MITTSDGIRLETAWTDATAEAAATIVLCHPHPLDRGTMNAPLIAAIARRLGESGFDVLRFNFRGVGRSEGTWGGGELEMEDVAAAVAHALERSSENVAVAGWSFGAATSLKWHLRERSPLPWAGIAPGLRSYRGAAPPDVSSPHPASRLVIAGDRDQFATEDEFREFAGSLGARIEVLRGSDHFFYFREEAVADLLSGHFRPG